MTKRSIDFGGIPARDLAAWCGVTLKTAQLWKTGTRWPGSAARRLIDLHTRGRVLPDVRGWLDWFVDGEKLRYRGGEDYHPGQLAAFRFYADAFYADQRRATSPAPRATPGATAVYRGAAE